LLSAGVSGNDILSSLVYSTPYDVYRFAEDTAGNRTSIELIEFSTIARTQLTAPVVTVASAGQTQLNVSVNTNVSGVELYMSTTSNGTYTLYETLTAGDLTAAPVTGLTQGTTRYFKAIALGDDATTVDSALSIEYSGTTSSVIQLNAVTGLASTPNSPTQNTLNWTDTNTSPNETYFRVRRSVNSDMSSASTLTSTLAANSTQYVDSTASAGQLYYYDVMCVGNGSTTSDSNTAVISCQTIVAYPTVSSAATSTDGLSVEVIYSKTMPASPTFDGISFSGTTSGAHPATGATRDGTNTSKVIYTIGTALVSAETVTMAYTAGDVVSNDGGVLQNFTGQIVTNNVVATVLYIIWDNVTTGLVSSANGGIERNANTGTWDPGASSNHAFTGDFRVEATLAAGFTFGGGAAMLGIKVSTSTTAYANLTHSICPFGSTSQYKHFQSGSSASDYGTTPPAVGHKIAIVRIGTTVHYELNTGSGWVTTYTSLVASSGTVYLATHINTISKFSFVNYQ